METQDQETISVLYDTQVGLLEIHNLLNSKEYEAADAELCDLFTSVSECIRRLAGD